MRQFTSTHIGSAQKQLTFHQASQCPNKLLIVCRAVEPAPLKSLDVGKDGPQSGINLILLRLNAQFKLLVRGSVARFRVLVNVGRLPCPD